MNEYEFTLVLDGEVTDERIEALYDAGADDALVGTIDGVGYLDFAREGHSFAEAVMSAVNDVESVEGLTVRRIEPEEYVTLSDIAERLKRTRESVRLLAAGDRGKGGFPPPVTHLQTRNRLWRWSEVADWTGMLSKEETATARFIAAMNAALELRCVEDTLDGDLVGTVLGLPGLKLRYGDAVKVIEADSKAGRPRKTARSKV